ncbi:TIGR00266 family protein [Desulfocapsa sulfexigens DSM 10523]|uniref:TIGR00266 family protein n=1 Tax=Desulfocapsa sulfexigens (strain DSM 10523 / SB164P1) TaxID=1167006 RepID=M1P2I9_DESSD|nr:TIGR00266 family protein [Desulfocapsa sulfexigens]AGF77703.1 TIGR00266 family protein [Desulfocapsa sulfexigens DSM 10523]
MSKWYVAVDGKSTGPMTTSQLSSALSSGQYPRSSMVWREGLADWQAATTIAELNNPAATTTPPPVTGTRAHEIDYEIFGHEMQFVEIELDPRESVVSEAGAMMYMSNGITMDTVFGDGSEESQSGGFFDKMLGAGKRLISGEGLFVTMFTHTGQGKAKVAFASPYPGKIIPLDLKQYNGRIICQKDAFLCAAKGVSIGIAFQKKIGTALFGGEGFIMQQLDGDGFCFVHAGGTIIEKELAAGETLRVDTGCLVALTQTVNYDIEFVGNVKSAIFGGESFFFATLQGPGHVWLQSLPFSRLAGRIHQAAPQTGGQSVGEGSVLGGLSTLFER